MPLSPATATNSGVTDTHRPLIHNVCQEENTFLFIRPSEPATMRLIDAGFATKSMDIHDKSSNWNLTAGLVPVDQAFSKKKTGTPKADIHPHDHGEAQAVHLVYNQTQFGQLWPTHFQPDTTEVLTGTCVTESGTHRHFHSTGNTQVCFLYHKKNGQVFWKWRHRTPAPLVKMYVWAYKGVPVTGDYDLWMVAPHVTNPDWGIIESVTDSHGRSAATKFTTDLMDTLNTACHRQDKPVFNHGAEAQNFSFTQERDREVAMFCPGTEQPQAVPWDDLPNVLHDLLRHGYVVIRNPKWITGTTLGAEDLAFARDLFPKDPLVQSQLATVTRRRGTSMGTQGSHTAHYGKLAFLRLVASIPEPRGRDLCLAQGYFQTTITTSGVLHWVKVGPGEWKTLDEITRKYSKEVEAGFGRAGFIMSGGHPSPIDMTIDRLEEAKFLSLDEALAGVAADIASMAVVSIREKMRELRMDMRFFEDCPYGNKTRELRWILGILWGLKSAGRVSLTHYREYHRFLIHWSEEIYFNPTYQRSFLWYIGEPLQKSDRCFFCEKELSGMPAELAGVAADRLMEKLRERVVTVEPRNRHKNATQELMRICAQLVLMWRRGSLPLDDLQEYRRFLDHWAAEVYFDSKYWAPYVWRF
jgi:hypothetical protein